MALTALRKRQIFTFIILWVCYASTYLLRKPLGVIKADLETEFGFTKSMLGWLDAALLIPYALMQVIFASVGDKFGPRRILTISLLASALSMINFGKYSSFSAFFIMLFFNGWAQSLCWPNVVKALGAWYPDDKRNSIFGIFGTCTFAGGVIGTALAVQSEAAYGWRNIFLLPSLILMVLAVIIFLGHREPKECNIEIPGKVVAPVASQESAIIKPSMWKLCQIPGVLECSIVVMCLKIVRYCMYMWLPLYLLDELNYVKTDAGMFSIVFEVGGVIGSASIGILIDRYYKNETLKGIAALCMFSTATLFLFQVTSGWGFAFNFVFLALAGASNCAPDALLTGSIPAELGQTGGMNAAASISGIVNGFGTTGTFMEGPIIGLILQYLGWSGVVYFMVILSGLAAFASIRGNVKLVQSHNSQQSTLESNA